MRIDPTEKEILNACLDYLNTIWGCKCWRQNTGAMSSVYKGKTRFMRFGQPGQADITGIYRGRRIEIEVKKPRTKPTLIQGEWLGEMQRLGAIAFWCTSVDECRETFAAITKPAGHGEMANAAALGGLP